MSKRLSIVIPVYNLENYIENTVNSCLRQDIPKDEYEVILIDDGSKDGSLGVLNNLKSKHENVVVFHKENGGVSSARNKGIELATGKYLWFVDGDDIIADKCLKTLLETVEGESVDLLDFRIEQVKDINARPSKTLGFEFSTDKENFPEFLAHEGGSGGGVWCQIFKTEMLKQNDLRFNTEIKYSEDVLFSFMALLRCNKVAKTKGVFYYYYQREGSAMHSQNHDWHIKSMHLLAKEYDKLASEYKGTYAEPLLKSKQYFAVKAMLFSIMRKGDVKFAKKSIKELKEEGLYPYPFLKESLKNNVTKKQAKINRISYRFPWKWYFMLCVRLNALKNKLKGR